MESKTPTRKTGLIGSAVVFLLLGAAGPQDQPDERSPTVPSRPATRSEPDPSPRALTDEGPQAEPSAAAMPTHPPLRMPLVPGQAIQPIDLASALRLAGARDLDIAIA